MGISSSSLSWGIDSPQRVCNKKTSVFKDGLNNWIDIHLDFDFWLHDFSIKGLRCVFSGKCCFLCCLTMRIYKQQYERWRLWTPSIVFSSWADSFLFILSKQRSPVCYPLFHMPAARSNLGHDKPASVSESESHSWNAGPHCECLPALGAADFLSAFWSPDRLLPTYVKCVRTLLRVIFR